MVIHIQKESSLSLFFLWKTKGWVKTKSQMCWHVVHDLSWSQLGVAVFKIKLSYCVSLDAPVGSCVTVCLFKVELCHVQSLQFSGGYPIANIFSLTLKIFAQVQPIS